MSESISTLAAGPCPSGPERSWPSLAEIRLLLRYTNPFCPNDEKADVIRWVHHATQGSDDGLVALLEWESRRTGSCNTTTVKEQWVAITHPPNATSGFLEHWRLLEAYGFDVLEILSESIPAFEPCDDEVVEPLLQIPAHPENPLTRYSLIGHTSELENLATSTSLILDGLVQTGQLSTIYGPPSSGKSVITTELVCRDIKSGRLKPGSVLYIDLDNNPTGLLDRLRALESVGCHLLAEGFRGFTSRKVVSALDEFIEQGHAKNCLVVVDTTKKVVDLMEKTASTEFAKRLRKLTNAGGTFLGLAHVNKHRAADGRPIYAGTSDLLEDFDGAHLLYEIESDPVAKTKTVLFECIKARGSVARKKIYRYSSVPDQSYEKLLQSVTAVDSSEQETIQRAQQIRNDRETIDAVSLAIRSGSDLKMSIVDHVTQATRSSRRTVLDTLDRYCGADPAVSFWDFSVGERGGKRYRLLSGGDDVQSN